MKIVKKLVPDESKFQGFNLLSMKLLKRANISFVIIAFLIFYLSDFIIPQEYYLEIHVFFRIIINLCIIIVYVPIHEILHVSFGGKNSWKKSTLIIGFPTIGVFI